MSLRTALERRALAAMLATPQLIRNRLVRFAEPMVRRELDPDLRLVLAMSALRPPLDTLSPAKARRLYADLYKLMDVPREAVAFSHDVRLQHDEGKFMLRVYRPMGVGDLALPGVLFFHGGGHTIGSVQVYDNICRFLANRLGAMLVSVDYRLAPEHRFPAAADDALAAWAWMVDNAEEQGMDPERLAVMGDSAGGNLAAVISQRAKERKMPLPALQVLVYPTLDCRRKTESVKAYAEHLGLTRSLIEYFDGHYLGDPADARHPMASPQRHRALKGQPPTLMVVCTDPLRDEGLEYAARLEKVKVPVTLLDYPQLVHGFFGMGGMVRSARKAILEICDTMGKML